MEESVKQCQAITIIVQHSLFTLSILSYSECNSFLYLEFIAKRIYQNNMVGFLHLVEGMLTT